MMKDHSKIFLFCCITAGLFWGCHSNNHAAVKSAFQKSLIQKKIKGTSYYLSIPANYVIKENNGPDFSVYYFYPSDTSDKRSFRGGFYLGNAPGGSGRDYDSCKVVNIHSPLFGDDKRWTIYDCDGNYSIQIITDSKSGMDWDHFIHAFGRAGSKPEINKLLEVYATLTKKE